MSIETYISEIENQNEELMKRLAEAEYKVTKFCRKKPVLPLFTMFKYKDGKIWRIEYDMLSVCDSFKEVQSVIKYNLTKNIFFTADRKRSKLEVIGFKCWKQSLNYKWCLSGISFYFNSENVRAKNIELNETTGQVYVTY
jgi:hypothetical protein